MQRSNTRTNGFRTMGYNNQQPQGRGFGASQQNQMQYDHQEDDYDAPVAWLNIMVAVGNGERKKLGKGIPLRDSNPLERALLDLLFDENGEPTGFDIEQLKGALMLDVRPAGSASDQVEIDLFGALSATPNTTNSKSAKRHQPQQEQAPQEEADAGEPEQPTQRRPRQARLK